MHDRHIFFFPQRYGTTWRSTITLRPCTLAITISICWTSRMLLNLVAAPVGERQVLDEEVDTQPPPEQALLPSVLSFLSSFPQYLDIVVQCTRKTEVRSWRTLFANLPPPEELFEESLEKGNLKTAGGYLLVLHTFEELRSTGDQVVRLLQRAKQEQDWELCKELARFLMALDESGATLRSTLELVELKTPSAEPGLGGRTWIWGGSLYL